VFENALHTWFPSAQVWVTEAGVRLDNPATSDSNSPAGGGPVCWDDDAPQNPGDTSGPFNFGGCVDGNSTAQQNGTIQWELLEDVSSGGVTTTQVYWYEWELQNGLHSWDSAMVVPSGASVYGRASYTVLYGATGGNPPYPDAYDYQDAYSLNGAWVGTR
jgi:hypothetical protein